MSNVCNFCNKVFTSVSNLNYHKKTSKTCINSRPLNTLDNNIQDIKKYICEYCEYELSCKKSLDNHLSICKTKEIKSKCLGEINALNEKINELNKQLTNQLNKDFEINKSIKIENDYLKEQNIKLEKRIEELEKKNNEYLNKLIQCSSVNTKTNCNNTYINNNNSTTNLIVYSPDKIGEFLLDLKEKYKNNDNIPTKDIDNFFLNDYTKTLKNMTCIKDINKDILTIINEDGSPVDIESEKFVIKSFNDNHLKIYEVSDILEKNIEKKLKDNKCNKIEANNSKYKLSNIKTDCLFSESTETSKNASKLLMNKLKQ